MRVNLGEIHSLLASGIRGSYLIGNFEPLQEGHELLLDVRLLWGQIAQELSDTHLWREPSQQ